MPKFRVGTLWVLDDHRPVPRPGPDTSARQRTVWLQRMGNFAVRQHRSLLRLGSNFGRTIQYFALAEATVFVSLDIRAPVCL